MTYTPLSSWVCPILFSCLVATTACSSSDANPNPGTSSGGNAGSSVASGGSSNVGGSVSMGGSAPGGTSSGGSATGGTSSGGNATGGASSGGSNVGGSAAGGASGSAGSANAGSSSGGSAGGVSIGAFTLTSPGWTANAACSADAKDSCTVFPKDNIGTSIGGSNKSPELDWIGAPSSAMSYAIVLQDLTNITMGKPFVHWVMWNIPGTTHMLPAGLETAAMPSVPAGSSQKSFGMGYQGSGKCGNVYEFVLYVLPTAMYTGSTTNQTAVRDGLVATNAPTATLRAKSGAPGCTP